jgi:hypothetical protein
VVGKISFKCFFGFKEIGGCILYHTNPNRGFGIVGWGVFFLLRKCGRLGNKKKG